MQALAKQNTLCHALALACLIQLYISRDKHVIAFHFGGMIMEMNLLCIVKTKRYVQVNSNSLASVYPYINFRGSGGPILMDPTCIRLPIIKSEIATDRVRSLYISNTTGEFKLHYISNRKYQPCPLLSYFTWLCVWGIFALIFC